MEFGLTFHPSDFAVVGILVLLEGLLSADNALVLALLVRPLPHAERQKALLYGLIGAFVFRAIGIFFAGLLINLWWVCAAGAVYLMGLALRHFIRPDSHGEEHSDSTEHVPAATTNASFWKTVMLVEMTDIVFAVDSILVAVALVSEPSKIWIVYLGGIIGIIMLRLAATGFTRIIERYPKLDSVAYALVGWAGVKLASASVDIYYRTQQMHEPHLLPKWAFWAGFVLILAIGIPLATRRREEPNAPTEPTHTKEHNSSIPPRSAESFD
ncbi:MAG: membrane protein [Armatimonadaceae bacterium]